MIAFSGHMHASVIIIKRVNTQGCLGGAAVRRRTRDRKLAGSTPDRGAINSTRSTQPISLTAARCVAWREK